MEGEAAIGVIAVNRVGMGTADHAAMWGAIGRLASAPQRLRSGGVRGSMAPRGLVVVFALVSGAGVASASPLVWRAPSGCPGEADVRTRIEQRLGAAMDHTVHGIEITVVRERGAFVATVDARALTVANDVRTLRSARCNELADAVAVIVARLASESRDRGLGPKRGLDPDSAHLTALSDSGTLDAGAGHRGAGHGRPAPRAGHDGTGHSNRVAARDDEEIGLFHRFSEKLDDEPSKWGGGVHLHGLSGAGALPALNLGVELAGYLRRFDRFVEVGAGMWVPQSAYLNAGAPARVEVSLQVITLRAGWSPRELPLRAWVTAEIGRIQGIGVAVDDPQAGSARWTALGAGFNVQWPMSPMARLVGSVELMIPTERTVFMLSDGRDLYQPSSAAARCSLGLEVGWK